MAQEFWKNEDPLKDRIVLGHKLGVGFSTEPPRQIVGIVGNVRDLDLEDRVRPIVYVPIAQIPDAEGAEFFPTSALSWVIRTQGRPVRFRRSSASCGRRQASRASTSTAWKMWFRGPTQGGGSACN
jgi:hypothetical protein